MDNYLLLKIAHSLPGVLVLLGVLAHLLMLWKAQSSADPALLQRKLRNTRRFSLPALAVLALSLPLSGWWLVHLGGFALGQSWLLASSALFILLVLAGLLLAGRLAAWQALGALPAPRKLLRLTLAYAVLIVGLLLAIMALMGAKPA
ncbi:DUF2269 family protein [Pseudomonas sp. N040]|uniref:DUF2269 family protein n=1 Tax=Pseudomonas sp. N040 TaxID=2785325 RepID=UPI0018A2A84B|nr:DUF2269 family protein [Pseudomonas sp. N040]MBF7730016.1 DUF2269 family protein [Pseudomonas sp. N040]MBW7013658.1 DUF2269 domain-containing protein [Pseudomonas sp. N040]